MERETLINNALQKIRRLPNVEIQEVNDFADALLRKIDDKTLVKNSQTLSSASKAFDFLNDEEELYDESDLIERYR